MSTDPPRIAFAGPVGAGKTSLLAAWPVILRNYNAQQDAKFLFELLEADSLQPLSASQLLPKIGTVEPIDLAVRFRRQAQAGPDAAVNHREHLLLLLDAPGDYTLNKPTTPQTEQPLVNITQEGLDAAECVIVVLDPPTVLDLQRRPVPTRQYAYYQEIEELLVRLLKPVRERRWRSPYLPKRHIAVCVTKADTLETTRRKLAPFEVIAHCFGDGLHNMFIETQRQGLVTLESFVVSATGFRKENPDQPNYDSANKTLADPVNWYPWRVAAPFFWFLERLERQRLQPQQRARYQGYPQEP